MKKTYLIVTILLLFCMALIGYRYIQSEISDYSSNDVWDIGRDITPLSDIELKKKWDSIYTGQWALKNKKLTTIEGEKKEIEYGLIFKTPILGDVALEFDAKISSEENINVGADLSVILCSDNNYTKRYDLQLGASQNKKALIQMINIPLTGKAFSLQANKTYHIRAEKSQEKLKLFCDNELILETDDSFFLNGTLNGIYTYGPGKEFWNIKIFRKKMNFKRSMFTIANIQYQTAMSSHTPDESLIHQAKMKLNDIINAESSEKEQDAANHKLAKLSLLQLKHKEAQKYFDAIHDKNTFLCQILKLEIQLINKKLDSLIDNIEDIKKRFPEQAYGISSFILNTLYKPNLHNLSEDIRNKLWDYTSRHNLMENISAQGLYLKDISFFMNSDFKIVYLKNNQIEDLSPLNHLKRLKELNATHNKISSIPDLSNTKIIDLALGYNPITNINGLKPLKLRSLDLSYTHFNDLSILKELTLLKNLSIDGCKVSDLSPLQNLPLNSLSVKNNLIQNISSLKSRKIKKLLLSYNQIEDIQRLPKIEYDALHLDYNKIKDISSLRNVKISILKIDGNPIIDITPLLETPPEKFYFNCSSLSNESLENTISTLKKKTNQEFNITNAKIYLALRKKDKIEKIKALKSISKRFKDHYYLRMPLALNWEQAKIMCHELGGHLITLNTKQESEWFKNNIADSAWIGLTRENGMDRWVTNESVLFHSKKRSNINIPFQNGNYVTYPKSNEWTLIKKGFTKNTFVIEWDK